MNLLVPTRHWPTLPIGAVRPAGTTWGAIEPVKGAYNWQGLDSWVNQAQIHGAEFDYVFLNTPQWASTRPFEKCNRGFIGCAAPPRPEDWEAFITALVTRYKGRIADYELWNEPNAPGFWSGSPAEMVDMAARAYRIIKSIDPKATVLSPASASPGWPLSHEVWLDHYLTAGGGKYADVIAWHGYVGRENVPPLPPEDLLQQINAIRAVLAKHGLSNLPLWNTEGSFEKDIETPDEQQQATFVVRWYLLQFTHGVGRTYWYQWDNVKYGTMWREQTGLTPAGEALKEVLRWLDGVTDSTPCASSNGSLWSCDLIKGNKRFRAVWNTSGPATYSDTKGFSSYADVSGAQTKITGLPIAIGPRPILLQVR